MACSRVNFINFFLPLICVCLSFFLSIKIIVLYLFAFFLSSLSVFNFCVPRLFPSFSVTYFFIRFPSVTFRSLFPATFQAVVPVSRTSRHLAHSCPYRYVHVTFRLQSQIQTNSHLKCCYSICLTCLSTGGTYVADDKCRRESRVILIVVT